MNHVHHIHAIAGLAVIGGIGASAAPAAIAATTSSVIVTNCNDSGTGSLRAAAAVAPSGGTIDLRGLRCSVVSLQGQILLPQHDLRLLGHQSLTIDANRNGRVFQHTGTGKLYISGLTLANGLDFVQSAAGGCLRSAGDVELRHVRIHHCDASGRTPPDWEGVGTGSFANGGGVFASGHVLLADSVLEFNNAGAFSATGGGVSARTLTIFRSRLHGNTASFGGGAYSGDMKALFASVDRNTARDGGGLYVFGNAFIHRSTIALNVGYEHCGGICIEHGDDSDIVDSTLSGNRAGDASAAGLSGHVSIHNSTIAFNRVQAGIEAAASTGGSAVTPWLSPFQLHIESSIVAANPNAIDIGGFASDTLDGADNLIGTSALRLPADTLRGDPGLRALQWNGGPTPTHALVAGSAAIDRGNNALGLAYDQRDIGYPRVKGIRTDIGAYER